MQNIVHFVKDLRVNFLYKNPYMIAVEWVLKMSFTLSEYFTEHDVGWDFAPDQIRGANSAGQTS